MSTESNQGIHLTERAAQRIQLQLQQRGHGLGLRVGIKKSGCSGHAYTMDYADAVEAGDAVFEQHGATVVVRREYLPLLVGTTLDFQKQGLNQAFKFVNPNARAHCGCGESFTT
ncbi:HesB/IscA family protein [Sinimarinibacterium flocculans]|uniref:Iron-sulfur cluster assembly protein n=1 Tax=Sinimarinibacterium flocculans TaxID=985250 RepID=A0A318E9W2_9GAMM|nr:iron-sulfur cluster assembly accessory protein [Sinimarinibacterium flocculans]MEC9363789.1 iron-sulfur cluster assembly accessory protein [Pseudomonadota bacterium]PXV66213.1 iron-sulfur cluster assembly protein [Sinimarinibacterium flocculans]